MIKYSNFFATNAHCALVVALSGKNSPIQQGYRKCGTHARVFSQSLGHENSKNEIRKEIERKERKIIKCLFKLKAFDITMSTYIS